MDQMRGRVIAPRGVAFFHIDFRSYRIAGFQSSFFDSDLVNDQTLCRRVSISYRRNQGTARCEVSTIRVSGWVNEVTHVSNLAARLSIEGSLIQNRFAFLALAQLCNFFIAADHSQHLRIIDSRCFIAAKERVDTARNFCIDRLSLCLSLDSFGRASLLKLL